MRAVRNCVCVRQPSEFNDQRDDTLDIGGTIVAGVGKKTRGGFFHPLYITARRPTSAIATLFWHVSREKSSSGRADGPSNFSLQIVKPAGMSAGLMNTQRGLERGERRMGQCRRSTGTICLAPKYQPENVYSRDNANCFALSRLFS